ncbi:MAG: FtsX-like permease family protein [Bacteroidota bacterium]
MLGKIAWKNIIYKPLNTALCVSLLLFGVGIISLLLLIQHQLEQKFERDLQNIDLVIGAKGSPLQLVLSAIYHLDAPTGNIKLAEAKEIMEKPMVAEAIPLAYGDSYLGHRILGTTPEYINKYNGQLAQGALFSKSMEVTLGADIAVKSGLSLGDTFLGTHGEVEQGHVHDNHPYTVVGILKKTNSVLDRLVLTNIESVWEVHSHEEGHDHPPIDTVHALELDFDHDHEHHDHDHDHDHADHVITADSMEITAVLLKYKTKMAVLNMPRLINEQTNMQAVLPALEINRLFYMLGIGATTLKLIAGGIMLMAGFSVFFVLYSRLRDRKHELALMRSVGYRPGHLFSLLLLEGLILAGIGYIFGWLLSRVGIHFINQQAESDFNLQFGAEWVPGEEWLLLLTFTVGIVSALLPAWQAMRMDVSEILSES